MLTRLANATIAAAYAPEHRRLIGVHDVLATQEAILRRLLRRNADSWFGRRHSFATIRSIRDFRDAVPLTTWHDYDEPTHRIAAGEPGVLTHERVLLLEPSSGSTSATKLVPYTATLRAEYQRGLKPWLHDLYRHHPRLLAGRSYWSITPAATGPQPDSAIPIGFDEDADYLGPLAKRLVSAVFAVPAEVARTTDMDAFLDDTCHHLLAAEDLALVSVWNPTLFTLLLDRMRERADALLPRLSAGRRTAVAGPLADGDWAALWPRLGLLSCWADAAAAAPAADLAARFPGVTLQPKGLLATEGFVSLPLTAAGGAVLSARSHFFEFLPEGDDADPRLAHELTAGGRYAVVLTTGGGLYRYRLGDLVEVTHHHGPLPVLRFCGRVDHVSDLVGEKLNEAFVTRTLADVGVPGATLVAASDHYRLLTHADAPGLADRVDAALRANFHYDYARRLGQLGHVVVELRVAADPRATQAARGGKLGDVKPVSLIGPMP